MPHLGAAQCRDVQEHPPDYGHPVPSILEAIEDSGSEVWRTDERGTVTVTFRGGEPVVTSDSEGASIAVGAPG